MTMIEWLFWPVFGRSRRACNAQEYMADCRGANAEGVEWTDIVGEPIESVPDTGRLDNPFQSGDGFFG
jgi:hypothetical protein